MIKTIKIYTILAFVFITVRANTQNILFDSVYHVVSKSISLKHYTFFGFIGSFDSDFYTADVDKNGQIITSYGLEKLEKKNEFRLAIPLVDNKNPDDIKYFINNNNIINICSFYKSKGENVVGQVVDIHGKIVINEKSLIDLKTGNSNFSNVINVQASDNRTKLLFTKNIFKRDDYDPTFDKQIPIVESDYSENVELWLYDNLLVNQMHKVFLFPNKQYLYKIEKTLVSNSGDIFLITKTLNKENKLIPENNYHVFKVSTNSTELEEITITTENVYIENIDGVILDSLNKTVFVGFYSKTTMNDLPDGVFYSVIDLKNLESNKFQTTNLEKKILLTLFPYFKEGIPNPKKGSLEALQAKAEKHGKYNLKQVFGGQNGTYKFISEFEYQFSIDNNNPNSSSNFQGLWSYYNKSNIFEFDVDSTGIVKPITIIPQKENSLATEIYIGNIYLNTGRNTSTIFNDNADNLNKSKNNNNVFYFPYNINTLKINFVCVSKDSSNSLNKYKLRDLDFDYRINTRDIIRINDQTVILTCPTKKNGVIMFLKLSAN